METASFLSMSTEPGAAVARIECPSVAQRETPILQTELLDAAQRSGWRIAVDLSNVTILTSVGIGLFVTLHKKCHENKGRLALFGLNKDILDLLKLTRLDKLLSISRDRDAALKAIR